MPKISKQYASFRIAAQNVSIDYDVMYSSKQSYFYVVIPDRFMDTVKLLSDEQKTELNIVTHYENRSKSYPVINHKEESYLVNSINWKFKKLAEMGVTTRPVILVWFFDKSRVNFSSGDAPTNKDHSMIHTEYGLFYTTETKVNGGKPDYGRSLGYNGEEKAIILDDTPENREFLEFTYVKLKELTTKMASFFGQKETLLQLISSNQKLIG